MCACCALAHAQCSTRFFRVLARAARLAAATATPSAECWLLPATLPRLPIAHTLSPAATPQPRSPKNSERQHCARIAIARASSTQSLLLSRSHLPLPHPTHTPRPRSGRRLPGPIPARAARRQGSCPNSFSPARTRNLAGKQSPALRQLANPSWVENPTSSCGAVRRCGQQGMRRRRTRAKATASCGATSRSGPLPLTVSATRATTHTHTSTKAAGGELQECRHSALLQLPAY